MEIIKIPKKEGIIDRRTGKVYGRIWPRNF